MTIVVADIDPGNLTMIGILGLFGLGVVLCLVGVGATYIDKDKKASRGFLIAAAVLVASGIVLSVVGKVLGVKYGFP